MRKNCVAVSCLVLAIFFGAGLNDARSVESRESKQVTCTGKVVDEQGRPIAGVKVTLSEMMYNESYDHKLTDQTVTDTDGKFSLTTTIDSDVYRYGYIVAQKQGLALGFDNWRIWDGNGEVEIKLGQAKELAGTVVDENNNPVSDAQVSVSIMVLGEGKEQKRLSLIAAPGLLTTSTNPAGKFAFARIPANATAEFIVKKAGKATVSTYKRSESAYQKLHFAPDQTDIKLVSPVEARIEGIVVDKSTGEPVGGMKVMVSRELDIPHLRHKPITSNQDGTFCVDALVSDRYVLELVSSRDKPADWVAEPVEVITKAGKTSSGIKVDLIKGGVLEVVIRDAVSKKPVEKANVSFRNQANSRYQGVGTDENGMARIRLMPGDYQADIYKSDYSRQRIQNAINVEEGKTEHLEYELFDMPKINGFVRDEKGSPIEGVELEICPSGGREDAVSDAEGKFEVTYDLDSWPSGRTPVMFLVGRHEGRNLAAAVQLDEDTRNCNIELEPGVTISGVVVKTDGKGIANVQVRLMLQGPRWGSTIGRKSAITDKQGKYEIKAIPKGYEYEVYAMADGYGRNRSEKFNTENAVNNHLEAGKLILAAANLSVSGVVADDSGKPFPGVRISCFGDNQPYRDTQTDVDGKFTLENICAGKIRISADKTGAMRLSGSIETEGGATDVRIVISQRPSSTRYEPKRPPSLIGRPLPELKEAGIDLPPADTDGRIMLVCFFDMEQRPSRHCITQLAKQAEQLKSKGVTIVAVQASKIDQDALSQWKNKYNIPFPVGMVQGDVEKARFAWGIRSLPWLILTDKSHIVSSNGFLVAELDNKIQSAQE